MDSSFKFIINRITGSWLDSGANRRQEPVHKRLYDQNADGDCDDATDSAAPADVEACLNDETTCQAVPATFSGLAAGNYTTFLRFPGASQGYYPTT
jgi:hypothetical protein